MTKYRKQLKLSEQENSGLLKERKMITRMNEALAPLISSMIEQIDSKEEEFWNSVFRLLRVQENDVNLFSIRNDLNMAVDHATSRIYIESEDKKRLEELFPELEEAGPNGVQ
jgi:hypothetical protein